MLVVEDNKVNQLVMCEILKTYGLTPVTAVDGKSAVEIFAKESIDLVFMDIQMPEMDDMQATLKIRELENAASDSRRVPIVAFTANAWK
ncbi:MAG: CheY-like chemotaxis protein [Lysobacterales bacterium]